MPSYTMHIKDVHSGPGFYCDINICVCGSLMCIALFSALIFPVIRTASHKVKFKWSYCMTSLINVAETSVN